MDCAFDDDRTIVVAMVDFAISTQFGFIYCRKLIDSTAIFSHSFDHRAFKLYHKLLYGHFIMDCAFDEDRSIMVAMVDFAISAQFGLICSKKPIASKRAGMECQACGRGVAKL